MTDIDLAELKRLARLAGSDWPLPRRWGWDSWKREPEDEPKVCLTSEAHDVAHFGGWDVPPPDKPLDEPDDGSIDMVAWMTEREVRATADAAFCAAANPAVVAALVERVEACQGLWLTLSHRVDFLRGVGRKPGNEVIANEVDAIRAELEVALDQEASA